MEQQSFFYSNTHYSPYHHMHDNTPVATDWQLCVPSSRPSGFEMYKDLGHTNYYGQTTLGMYTGDVYDKPVFKTYETPSYTLNDRQTYLTDYSYLNNSLLNNNFNQGMNDW